MFAHVGIEEPSALRAGFLGVASVRGREVAIGQALIEDGLVRPDGAVSRRSDCLYSSSQLRPSHFRPSKMELTDASVLRSTSVSSRRRTMVPPLRRAYSQLKMKVRALPT